MRGIAGEYKDAGIYRDWHFVFWVLGWGLGVETGILRNASVIYSSSYRWM